MKPNVGGLIAVIDRRGSRFATAGRVRGWLPAGSDDAERIVLSLSIDGVQAAIFEVPLNGQPIPAGQGYPERHLFEVDLPIDVRERSIELSLYTENGSPVGIPGIRLEVDGQGDAILAELNDALRDEVARALKSVKRGKAGIAHVVFQQVFCPELFSDNSTLLVAARVAADQFDIEAAGILLDRAMTVEPVGPAELSAVAKILLKIERYAEAREYFDRAIAADPAGFDARNGRIKAIIGQEDWKLAMLEANRLRATLAPATAQFADLAGTIAWLHLNLSQPDRALAEATSALMHHPKNTRLMQMRGDALVRFSRYEDAIAIYKQALRPDPKAPLLRKRLASALLLAGEFAEAADQDQGRMLTPTFIKLNNAPENKQLWAGELHLDGKLLVWAEVNFGVGQNLLHGSVLPDLIALGIDIVLEVERRLVPVFAAAFPQIAVVEQVKPNEARGAWMTEVAAHIPIGSLVRYFRRSRLDFATSRPFLKNDPAHTQALRAELQAKSGFRRLLVGISWTSNNPYVGDEKTVPLQQMLRALDVPGVQLVNLQYGQHDEVIAEAVRATGIPLIEAKDIDRTEDLKGMCDLVAAMDLVICIGHTTAHIAGGLGIPNFVLIPSSPFAHWLGSGESCVWYPHSRIIRQQADDRGDWTNALAQVGRYLALTVLGLDLPQIQQDPLVMARNAGEGDGLEAFCRNTLALAMSDYRYRQIDELTDTIRDRFPANAGLLAQVGDCHFRIGNYEDALGAYQEAINAGGDFVELTMSKVQVLLECYELEVAAALMKKLFAEVPDLEKLRPDLVVIEAQIMACQNEHKQVVERLTPVLRAHPENIEAALTQANAYSARSEFMKASRALTKTLAGPPDGEVISAIGVALGRAGMMGHATKMLDRARAFGPDPLGTFWRAQFDKPNVKRSARLFQTSEMTLPVAAAERVTVFVCMDTSYCLRYLGSIAASIAANSPDANLHVHLVNPNEESLARLRMVESMLGAGRVSSSQEKARLVYFDDDQRKTYFASIRFVRLSEVMHAAPGTYFVMDVDNLVRGDLSSCRSLVQGADVMVRNRFSLRPHLALAACGIILADTDAARDFMRRTADYILDAFHSGHVAWFLDQIALTIAMKEPTSGTLPSLNVAQLPRTLLDWDFLPDSLVWTGKGKRRFKNRRYQTEYNRYSDKFNQVILQEA
ncbi:tetratricopeptide repeat protein [Novosphingobium olei]|uniref:tetratricopeptide repeat protein n=1 Tax=Novosphingobium olei TaxID=2728851 RepID=UPI00308F965F|nr:hypothetical protein NSDW_29630 [Novosphingobium olei]